MARLVAFAVATYCYLQPGLALAQDAAKQLAGSWKLNSWTIQIIGGEVTEPFGPNPKGRAVFTPDGVRGVRHRSGKSQASSKQ
jgi:Lipocalin-like domain